MREVIIIPITITRFGVMFGIVCGDVWRCYFVTMRYGTVSHKAESRFKRAIRRTIENSTNC